MESETHTTLKDRIRYEGVFCILTIGWQAKFYAWKIKLAEGTKYSMFPVFILMAAHRIAIKSIHDSLMRMTTINDTTYSQHRNRVPFGCKSRRLLLPLSHIVCWNEATMVESENPLVCIFIGILLEQCTSLWLYAIGGSRIMQIGTFSTYCSMRSECDRMNVLKM